MRSNFFDDLYLGFKLPTFEQLLYIVCHYAILSCGFTLLCSVVDSLDLIVKRMPFILFIFPLIPVILYCIIFYCKEYFDGKANKYSLFKFKDFKQWYNLSPESFIFDNNLYCLYYIHSTNKDASIFTNKGYRKKYWYDDSGMEWHDVLDKTTMYPKTLFDSILYSLFVVKIYRKLKKEEQHKEKIYDNIYANNETIRVMNSLQKNIDKVLKESQTIINIEQSKL